MLHRLANKNHAGGRKESQKMKPAITEHRNRSTYTPCSYSKVVQTISVLAKMLILKGNAQISF